MSIFSKIPVKKPKRFPHDLTHGFLFSPHFGELSPVQCEKMVPGDTSVCSLGHLEQFAPLSTKLYQDFRIKTESFFIPTRLVWSKFGDFMSGDLDQGIIHPFFTPRILAQEIGNYLIGLNGFGAGYYTFAMRVIQQFFGPNGLFTYLYGNTQDFTTRPWLTATYSFSDNKCVITFDNNYAFVDKKLDILPFISYYKIMAEYYLDENLFDGFIKMVDDVVEKVSTDTSVVSWCGHVADLYFSYVSSFLVNAPNIVRLYNLRQQIPELFFGTCFRNYPKDYFGGALPFVQRGNAVDVPLQGNGTLDLQLSDNFLAYLDQNTAQQGLSLVVAPDQSGVESGKTRVLLQFQSSEGASDYTSQHNFNFNNSVAVGGIHTTIENFRTAYQIQEFLENEARGGHRYNEQIFSHFGVKTLDYRLGRPEFIFGTTDGVTYGNVFTTSQDVDGNGVPGDCITAVSGGGSSRNAVYRVHEHGYYFTFYSIFPRPVYAYGLLRQRFELDRFDYFWPEFQHLGEQPVYLSELDSKVLQPNDGVFGYVPRYSQYKIRSSRVIGDFVDNLPTFSDFRDFSSPALSAKFISILPSANNLYRIFNSVTSDFRKIYVYLSIQHRMVRPIDYYGVPRLVL